MKLQGSVALVVGADSAVGAALVRGLLARGSAKVYAAKADGSRCRRQPGAVHVRWDTANPALAASMAVTLAGVTLLFNCLESVQHGSSALAGPDIQPDHPQAPPARRTLKLIEALAPALAAHGEGAVVNILSVVAADQPLGSAEPSIGASQVDWVLANGLRGQLVAQRTALLYFKVQNASTMDNPGCGDAFAGHVGLAAHFATRVLHEVEAIEPVEDHTAPWPTDMRSPAARSTPKGSTLEPEY